MLHLKRCRKADAPWIFLLFLMIETKICALLLLLSNSNVEKQNRSNEAAFRNDLPEYRFYFYVIGISDGKRRSPVNQSITLNICLFRSLFYEGGH